MKGIACAVLLLALAACGLLPDSNPATPEARALQGCASGRTASFLHENFPGGTDFNAVRCAGQGY
jgi:hypothetical protein